MPAGGPEEKARGVKRGIRAGAAEGPFPPAVESQGFTFVGAIGGVGESGEVVGPLASEQAARSIEILADLLAANGQRLEHVVKLTVYLTDLRDAADVDRVLERAFRENPPARSCVQVGALPEGQKVALEAVAVRPPEGKAVYDFMG